MPATSVKQQRFFGMVRAAQEGKLKHPSVKVRKAAKGISPDSADHFARTPHAGLPEKKSCAYQLGALAARRALGLPS